MNVTELNKKIRLGYLWTLASKWLNRSIGLISTLCLVRILAPEDFGIVALASIVLSFFVLIADAGTNKYLIQAQNLTDPMLHSAWSLNLALKLGCCSVLALLSYPIAHFMHNPQLYPVLLVFCLIPILNALKNIGMVLYEKALDFKPLTTLAVLVKLTVLPVTLSLAFYLQSYWALVWGLLLSEVLTVLGSYLMHPFRPRWSHAHWQAQWSFSKWHLVSVTTGYLRSRIDTILLGRSLSSQAVGLYRVGQEFAWLPFTELIAPATSAIYAGLAQLKEDRAAFNTTIINYLSLTYMLVLPCSMAIFVHSGLFTELLLGEKWREAAPVIGWLALLMLSMPLNICLQSALTALGRQKYLVFIDLFMLSAIVTLIVNLSRADDFSLMLFMEYRVLLVALFMLLLGAVYAQLLAIEASKLLWAILFPAIPTLAMIWLTSKLEPWLDLPLVLEAVAVFLAGFAVYSSCLVVAIVLAKNKFAENGLIIGALKKLKLLAQNG